MGIPIHILFFLYRKVPNFDPIELLIKNVHTFHKFLTIPGLELIFKK